jgi:hypothetical protein
VQIEVACNSLPSVKNTEQLVQKSDAENTYNDIKEQKNMRESNSAVWVLNESSYGAMYYGTLCREALAFCLAFQYFSHNK